MHEEMRAVAATVHHAVSSNVDAAGVRKKVGVDLGSHKTRSQVDTLEFDARPPGLGRFAGAWR